MAPNFRRGLLLSLSAYVIWGLFPVYLKAVSIIPSLEYFAHRIVWSAVLLTFILTVRRDWAWTQHMITKRTFLLFSGVAVLLCGNTLIYIWSVQSGYMVDASIGSYINPLINVVLGVVILRERIDLHHKIAIAFAVAGLIYLSIMANTIPWIGLVLSLTWGVYGLIKKMAKLGAIYGSWFEVAIASVPFLLYLIFLGANNLNEFGKHGAGIDILVMCSAIVTTTPILLFTAGMRSAPLSKIGFLQYISPTMQFLLGVLVYNEAFSSEKLIGFSIIWLGLIIYLFGGGLQQARRISASKSV